MLTFWFNDIQQHDVGSTSNRSWVHYHNRSEPNEADPSIMSRTTIHSIKFILPVVCLSYTYFFVARYPSPVKQTTRSVLQRACLGIDWTTPNREDPSRSISSRALSIFHSTFFARDRLQIRTTKEWFMSCRWLEVSRVCCVVSTSMSRNNFLSREDANTRLIAFSSVRHAIDNMTPIPSDSGNLQQRLEVVWLVQVHDAQFFPPIPRQS